jgi:hypothetical protein
MENVCIYDGRLIKSSLLLLQTGSCNFHTTLIALPRVVIHRARANSVSHKLRDLRGIKQTGWKVLQLKYRKPLAMTTT